MTEPTLGDLRADVAALKATTETEFTHMHARLEQVEQTQLELVKVATTGKASLRTLLWVGGLVTAAVTTLAIAWSALSG